MKDHETNHSVEKEEGEISDSNSDCSNEIEIHKKRARRENAFTKRKRPKIWIVGKDEEEDLPLYNTITSKVKEKVITRMKRHHVQKSDHDHGKRV